MLRASYLCLVVASSVVCLGCDNGAETSSSGPSSSGSGGSGGAGGSPSSTGGGGSGGSAAALCAKQHAEMADGQELIVCDVAFDSAPFVHLPAAEAGVDYMALQHCASFIDRHGKKHTPSKSIDAKVCTDNGADDNSRVHAFDIYKTTVAGSGDVTAFERFAVIDETNILRPLAGTVAEGTISKRKSDGKFDLDPSIPIRISIGKPEVTQHEKDGTTSYALKAKVENLSTNVIAADGSCINALTDNSANPFPGATEAVLSFFRVPSMHAAGDDEGVFDILADGVSLGTVMGPTWFWGPESLFSDPGTPPTYDGFGHGTPGYIPNVKFTLKKGGGGACTF